MNEWMNTENKLMVVILKHPVKVSRHFRPVFKRFGSDANISDYFTAASVTVLPKYFAFSGRFSLPESPLK